MTKQEEIRKWLGHNFDETNARVILDYLYGQGVVIKVERELPANLWRHTYQEGQFSMLRAGFVAVEPLIEEGKK